MAGLKQQWQKKKKFHIFWLVGFSANACQPHDKHTTTIKHHLKIGAEEIWIKTMLIINSKLFCLPKKKNHFQVTLTGRSETDWVWWKCFNTYNDQNLFDLNIKTHEANWIYQWINRIINAITKLSGLLKTRT